MGERRKLSILVAGASVLLAAGVLAAVLVNSGPTVKRVAADSAYVSRPVTNFVSVSRDGGTLSTFAYRGPCGEPLQNKLVAVESAQKIALTMLVHRLSKAEASETACALALFSPLTFPSIQLPTPLGHRMLVQGLNGLPIPTYGGLSIASPTVLPTGCHVGKVLPATAMYSKGLYPGVSWSCAPAVPFRPEFGPGQASLLRFSQWKGRVGGVGIPVQMWTKVHGQQAFVQVRAYGSLTVVQERAIVWFEQGQTFVIDSFSNLPPSKAHTKAVLTASELIQIANGLKL